MGELAILGKRGDNQLQKLIAGSRYVTARISDAGSSETFTISGNVDMLVAEMKSNGEGGCFAYENGRLWANPDNGWIITDDAAEASAQGDHYILVTHTDTETTIKIRHGVSGYYIYYGYIYSLK